MSNVCVFSPRDETYGRTICRHEVYVFVQSGSHLEGKDAENNDAAVVKDVGDVMRAVRLHCNNTLALS